MSGSNVAVFSVVEEAVTVVVERVTGLDGVSIDLGVEVVAVRARSGRPLRAWITGDNGCCAGVRTVPIRVWVPEGAVLDHVVVVDQAVTVIVEPVAPLGGPGPLIGLAITVVVGAVARLERTWVAARVCVVAVRAVQDLTALPLTDLERSRHVAEPVAILVGKDGLCLAWLGCTAAAGRREQDEAQQSDGSLQVLPSDEGVSSPLQWLFLRSSKPARAKVAKTFTVAKTTSR